MQKKSVSIVNKLGLHARASAKLTQVASQFASQVYIAKGPRRVNAKSIMGVMMLAAAKGATVDLEAEGADEEAAIATIEKLFADRFGEAE